MKIQIVEYRTHFLIRKKHFMYRYEYYSTRDNKWHCDINCATWFINFEDAEFTLESKFLKKPENAKVIKEYVV